MYGTFFRKDKAGRLKSSRLVSVNNFARFWEKGVVSRCLVPGPGMIKAEEQCLIGEQTK